MANIKAGKIKSRPQVYFLIRAAIYIVLSFITFLISILLASFVAFAFPLGGFSFLLLVLAISIIFFIILNVFLVKRFPAFYKRPLLFGFLLFVFLTGALSFLILQTPFHANILEYSKNNYMPIIGHLYKHSCGCENECACGHQCPYHAK